MKRIACWFVLIFLFSLAILSPTGALAASTSSTQAQALAWINSLGSSSADWDGSGQIWCVDLIVLYQKYLFGGVVRRGNGGDYVTGMSGCDSIPYYSGFVAQPGDIAVWNYGNSGTYGHVALVTDADDVAMVYSHIAGQNQPVTHGNWVRYSSGMGNGQTFWGVLRPQFTPATGTLDVNFLVNGAEIVDITGIGTFNITAGGSTLTGQTDFCRSDLANGSSYSIGNITPAAGYNYTGLRSGSDALTGTIVVGAQKTVWLCFESKTYTVSYTANTDDIVSNMPTRQTKTHGVALTLASNVLTRQNYDFLGWSASSTATTATYQPGGQYTLNANAILYAVWKLKSFTINFDPNGGTVSPTSKSVTYGSAYGSLPTPTKPGYTFDGWYTALEGGTKVTASTTPMGSADQTVYAHWSQMGELILPSAMQTIDEEAFMGDSHISHVVIPANCASIGNKAFADCENLISVRILGRNTMFESDTFVGSPNVVIYCYSGSRAQRLANGDGLEYHLIGVASDWVSTDSVPSGAEITDRKWTYTLREFTDSSSATLSGWTSSGSEITGWTDWSAWQNTEVTKSSDREVDDQTIVSGYNMISYCVSGPSGRSYQPSPTYTVRLQHGPYWWSKAELDSAQVFPANSYFNYADNVAGYVLDATAYCKMDGSDNGGYIPMFIQDTTYQTQWRYRDAIYTYYYYKDTDKESATDPSGQENVSNVQEWVKYVY